MSQNFTPSPSLPPPASSTGVVGWLRLNLFSSLLNTTFTFLALITLYFTLPPVINWAFLNATWTGTSASDCSVNSGACWAFIDAYFQQFMYSFYPEPERWRVNAAFILVIGCVALYALKGVNKALLTLIILIPYPIIAFYLFLGGSFGLEHVETTQWGGLFLTIVLSGTSIVVSFPIGIVLALGRRSKLPIVKALCVGFIEVFRGVPLISVLFMASVMFPLFLPEGVNFDVLLRATIGIILFQAAYMAEVIRGGLQAIPKGQYEAADALGFGYWRTMYFIILPQALKIVIPNIVSIFITLFKDTSLVMIIGLFDFLGKIQAATIEPRWGHVTTEGYVFAAFVYWVFCFSMSRYSVHLENKLHTGHKR